ncbi:MAG TPA: ribokinase [Rhodanobacter sp.]|nr:ribokinase [Rhodanobacter sp.]
MSDPVRNAVLVVGSANLDFVIRVAHVPAPGETVLGRDARAFPGGKGANQAVAGARAGGAPTRMLLALGDDANAVPIEASLRAAGVQPEVVRMPGEPTGMAFICVADDAENAITVAAGANGLLGASALPALDDVGQLLMQLEIPLDTVLDCARAARRAGSRVILNAAPARVLPGEMLSLVDVLVVNEGELVALGGHPGDLRRSLDAIAVPCVVVTLGARGCVARIDGEFLLQPAFAVDPLDTTAAGDTFCGVLAAALAQGEPWPQVLRHASAAAAIACTRLGAQASIPDVAEVAALLRDDDGATDATARAALARHFGLV